MNYFLWRCGLIAALVIGVAGVLMTAPRVRSAPSPECETALTEAGARPAARSTDRTTALPRLTEPPVLEAAGIPIEVDGVAAGSIDTARLAERPAVLQASDRRAWRISELLHNTHMHSNAIVHALTIDGGDYIISENGRQGGNAILVRRNTGELYVGWLDGAAHQPLADAERPAERIEQISRISITSPVGERDLPAAQLAVIIDGKPRQTVTAQSFAAVASLAIRGQRAATATAIDVAHAFGDTLQLVGLTAGGARVTPAPPTRDARAVIYLNRRARFKFAWVDASGEPIRDTKQREVSELVLASRSPVAAQDLGAAR